MLPSDQLIPARVVLWPTKCAFLSSYCASINIQSLGSVFHKNSNCSYIKRYYYIPFNLVHTVVKFGCTCFLTYCYSVRVSCRFLSCPFPSHSTTPNLHIIIKLGLLINPVNFIDNARSL